MSFPRLNHFVRSEFNYPDMLDSRLLLLLDAMRHKEGKRFNFVITINSDFRPEDAGEHGKGRAVDIVMRDAETKEPLPVLFQFIIALRWSWGGLGFYPFWGDPGIHCDIRPRTLYERTATWWQNQTGVYLPIWDYSVLGAIREF